MHAVAESITENSTRFAELIARMRAAQQKWARTEIQTRLRIVRAFRGEIARNVRELVTAFAPELRAQPAERLASELIPLAEACRFLEEAAPEVLSSRELTRKTKPIWLRGVRVEEHREPLGVVLIIGPSNYPFFLPAVQAVQALTAGNAVVIKPGAGAYSVLNLFRELTAVAGLAPELIEVLDEAPESARAVLEEGIDKVVLTGSGSAGRAVYRTAAEQLTPAILELSGDDPVFVLSTADVERAVNAIAFGLRWNGGNSCIAPKRIFVQEQVAESFEVLLGMTCPAAQTLPIIHFANEEEAIARAAGSLFALGAAVFGEPRAARAFAKNVRAGIVVVNDLIAPSADPRVTFGGRGESGFGTTRGSEGLRQFTAPKVVVVQGAKRLRHLEPMGEGAEELFCAYLALAHTPSLRERLRGLRDICAACRKV